MAKPITSSPPQRARQDRLSSTDRATRQQAAGRRRPGFNEEQTKDLVHSSGGGLSQSDPDHQLRGEEQLVGPPQAFAPAFAPAGEEEE